MTTERKKRGPYWKPPAEWLAPLEDRKEFLFCFALMGGAFSGKLSTPKPGGFVVEEIGEIAFTDIPFNRAMLAVSKHLREVYKFDGDKPLPAVYHNVMERLMRFMDFMRERLNKNDPRMEKYVRRGEDGKVNGVAEALIEAAASAVITQRGLNVESMFKFAGEYWKRDEESDVETAKSPAASA